MRPRGLILLVLLGTLLLIGAMSAAEHDLQSRRGVTTTDGPPPPAPAPPSRTIEAVIPEQRLVRARVGDTIDLRIRSDTPDIAKIPALGVDVAVGPGIAGQAAFRALAVGRFEVHLELADRDVGTIAIREPDADG